jgi:hypothetical protein
MTKKTKYFMFIAIALLLAYFLFPSNDASRILKAGRLADLPASAKDVKTEGWSSLFSGSDYLTYKATSEDIENFIKESSISFAPEVFDGNHQHLQTEPNDNIWQTEEYYKNKYFIRNGDWPEWFDPTLKSKGRIYEIPAENNHNWGEVIINDETNTVYIWVCWS